MIMKVVPLRRGLSIAHRLAYPYDYPKCVKVNLDHKGGSSRERPFHCTSIGLTPTITPNVRRSTLITKVVPLGRGLSIAHWLC